MNRRAFIASLGAASAGGVVPAAEPSAQRKDNSGLHEVRNYSSQPLTADVLVIGGGTAGTIAAIQAGRLGARTILVEAGSQLGGTTTTGGVNYPGLFHAWGKQIIAGIGWELVTNAVELNSDKLPDFTKPTGKQHFRHQVRVCGPLYAALAEEACLKAGVQLRYYEFPTAVEQTGDGWKVRLAGKGMSAEVTVKELVDCTGNASVVGMIGLPRLREKTTQPGTLMYGLDGYEADTLDMNALQAKAEAAVKAGTLKRTDFNANIAGFLRSYGGNAMHVPDADSCTSETHTATNIRGRQSVLRMMRFLKQQPEFALLHIERMQAETGVRETFRIVGETTVTVDDYVAGRVFDDAVAHSFYPIDLHVERGVKPEHLKEGVVPTIPLGALIPKGSKNLMVAGRCLSSDRLANSALRVQASCMAMGQAVGVTAALAARAGTTPLQVAMLDIRRALTEHGAIVPKTI